MLPRTRRLRLSAVTAVVLVAAANAGLTAAGTASAESATGDAPARNAQAAQRGCVTFDNLTEVIYQSHYSVANGQFPSVGETADYSDWFFDQQTSAASGTVDIHRKLIGVVHGHATVPGTNAAGHVVEAATEHIVLPGGTVEVSGSFDTAEMFAGKWITGPAKGISGRYRGMTGTRSFQLIKPAALLNAKIELCPTEADS
jgi:Allene oxide cyclase barrel like domain